jgi:DnaJ-class molecular chaperone
MKFLAIVSLFNNLANKRSIYDIYGTETLRKGVIDKDGNIKGGYNYGGTAYEIFEKFFGTANPYALIKDPDRLDDEYGSMYSSAFGGKYAKEKDSLPPVEVFLECSLEELYNGCVKKLVFERQVLNSDNRTTAAKKEELDVEIFKGYDKNTVLPFTGYGNEGAGQRTCK